MPPGKPRSKEDTWREEDLKKSLKGMNDDKRRHKDKDRSDDKRREKPRDVNGEDKERRRRKEEDGERRHRDKNESRDKDEKRHSRKKEDGDDEERRRRHEERKKRHENEDEEERRRRHEERKKRHENEDDDERRRRREERKRREEEDGRKKQDGGDDRERRHRKKDEDEEKERRKHRDKEHDEERRRRPREKDEAEERKHRKRDEKKDADGHRRHRDKDNDEERRRHHRDKDGSREGRHTKEEDSERRKRRDETEEERERWKEKEREERHRKRREEREAQKREEEELQKKSAAETAKADLQNGDAAGDDDEYNYEDEEFEDYDDDFEDESEGDKDESSDTSARPEGRKQPVWDINDPDPEKREMAEVMRAMNEENTRIMSASSRTYSDDEDEPRFDRRRDTQSSRNTAGRSFINFVSAKQRQMSRKAASKAKERGNEILKMVDLDVSAFDMFDLPPVREYDMYIMNFGRSNTKQAYVQTNEDNIDREIQTEEIDVRTKWCQHPPEDYTACGAADGEEMEDDDNITKTEEDTSRLGTFIQKAGQVIAILLEEQLAHKNQQELGGSQSNISLSDNFVQLGVPPFLKTRHVVFSCFSPIQSYLLLTVYSMPTEPSPRDRWRKNGIVCVWNVNEPSRPQKVLICSTQPVCCCFSPNKATLAFGGMRDGSVVVWDLRETSSLHQSEVMEGQDWVFRHPTYSTAGVTGNENHHSAVVSVLPIISPTESAKSSLLDPSKSDSDVGSGLSFQLASLEESAVLHVWVVAEINNPDIAGSESDLGLAPGGKIKLLLSSSIKLENPVRNPLMRSPLHAFDMQLLPSDPNHFYAGTDSGFVVHGVRHTGRAPPKSFRPEVESPVDILSIDFSPFDQPVFLVGCGDGSARLHNANFEHPIMSWPNATGGKAIRNIQWSKSRPSVFFVIDESSLIHVFDLLKNDAAPQISEKISKSRVTSFCLSNDHSATGLGLPGRQPQMVTTTAEGAIEVHNISKQFAVAQLDEVYQFASYLEQAL
ncbi:cytoplasmic dynein 2 intermediate chain 1-like isoform X2 [Lineus longissimus]|uniref:cytoplasmic dynein 2 intermediate chain 1-like isoform X2 n=1 Tax=Lineus longissimus TaxID=88925 RepID=UPI00315DA92E